MTSGVSKVVIDVGDQERAKLFWTERMGCALVLMKAPFRNEACRHTIPLVPEVERRRCDAHGLGLVQEGRKLPASREARYPVC